jgi:purine-nucleoside phosphorylase
VERDVVACLEETVAAVRSVVQVPPRIGVVLGTGLGGFAARLRNVVSLSCSSLPHMAVPRTVLNDGNVFLGSVDDASVICLQGRAHLYEGYPAWRVVHGVRLMARLGVRSVLLTDASGVLDPTVMPGTMMVVNDHLDFTSRADPLGSVTGRHFTPPSEVASPYDAALSNELFDAARSENMLSARIGQSTEIVLHEGVYAGLRDASSMTPAQMRMLHTLGAHAVGMGIVPEVAALRELGVRVAALCYHAFVAAPAMGAIEEEATGRFGHALFDRVVRAWVLRAHRSES